MGSSVDTAYIEALQQDLKIICNKLEENGHESILITVGKENHWMTGSEQGLSFLHQKLLLVTEFINFCAGCNEMRAKFDASHNESLDTPKPFNESVINMFDGDSGDDTDDYMDFEEGIDIDDALFIKKEAKEIGNSDVLSEVQNPNETSKIQNSTQEESDIQEATETSQVQNLNKGKEMQYEQSRENTTTVLPLKGMKRNATTKLKSKAAKLSEPRVVLFKLRSTRKENELNDKVSGGNDKLSGGSDKLSSGNDKVSGGNDKVSGGNDKVSGGNDKVSGGNDKVSGGNDKVSGGNDKVSVGLSAKMVKEEEEADQDLSSTCVRNSFKQKSQETCDFCLKEFLTQDSLDSHLKTADGWRCCLCRQEFQDKDKLTSHQQIHEATFECSECDKVFRRPLQLEDHIEVEHLKKTETKKGEYPCSRCGYVFKFEMHLEKHNQTMPECKPEMTNEEILKLRRLEQISFHDPVTGEFRKKTYKQLLANNAMKCEICLKTFEKQNILRVHLVSHSDSTPYTCYICNTSFKLNYRLAKHMKKHDARPYNCSLCAKTFSTEARRNNHVTSLCDFRKPIPDLECTACGYSFVSRVVFGTREWMHTGTNHLKCVQCGQNAIRPLKVEDQTEVKHMFKCMVCTKEFTTASSKNRHMAIHKLEKTHKCEVCSKVFNTKGNLRQHKRLVHNKEPKNFMCEICGKDFDRKCRLTEHSRVHTGERPFVCDVKKILSEVSEYPCSQCGKVYGSQSALCRHKRSHGSKVFKCEFCDKLYYRVDVYKWHLQKHKGDRHLCQDCGKSFCRDWYLKRHMETAHLGKYLVCDSCGKQCPTKQILEGHIAAKHGIKPFECPTCNRRFTYRLTLRRHMLKYCGNKKDEGGPYICAVCNKEFKDKKGLRQHRTKHATDPRYVCAGCGKQFRWSSGYAVHRRVCRS